MKRIFIYTLSMMMVSFQIENIQAQTRPNILIIIADDMGTDAMGAYNIGTDLPNTPNLDDLIGEGILFTNAWAYGTCAPSRASLLTGRYGNKNSITRSGPNLPDSEITLFEHINSITGNEYANAAFGKWHLGNGDHPNSNGVDHYDGNIFSGVDDYYNWERWINGVKDTSSAYVTTYITDEAIRWIDNQDQPWFLWMAYNAPHGPVHLPPDSMYTRTNTTSNFDQYICMIESVDHEAGRLYNSLTQEEKDNTIIIFVGDNGTPNSKLQRFPARHGKGTLYEGGINVPMFITGYGVKRVNEKEDALVCFTDVFATLTELLGTDLPGGIDNSYSFYDLLSDPNAGTRTHNYSELSGDEGIDRAIRNNQYKLIIRAGQSEEFYDLLADPFEENDLMLSGLTADQQLILDELWEEADKIFYSWSCNDDIQNGDENDVDCGGSACAPCQDGPTTIFAHYFENGWDGWTSGGIDCSRYSGNRSYEGNYSIRIRDNSGDASAMISDTYDLSAYTSAELSFHFLVHNMEPGEDFLLEINTGSGWDFVEQFVNGENFINNQFTSVTIPISDVSNSTQFKFTCDASHNQDRVFIDAVILMASNQPLDDSRSDLDNSRDTDNSIRESNSNVIKDNKSFLLFPNPANDFFKIEMTSEIKQIRLYDVTGQMVLNHLGNDVRKINVSDLSQGLYFVIVETEDALFKTRIVKL